MPFLKFELDAGTRDPEPFEDALFAAGATSVTLADAADDPVLEPAPGKTPLWPTVRIEALFDPETDPTAIVALLQAMTGAPLPAHRFGLLADRPWEREWLKDFRPMRFGKRLWICPGGQRPSPEPPGEGGSEPVLIELDPGLAFGTGTHPTTALCLEWLDGAPLAGRTVIDYGCGSGILAIAALRLGAATAIGIDIDPQALTASHDNALRNGVAERLVLQAADQPVHMTSRTGQADVLLANILAGPLESLSGALKDLVRPGGALVLSGLLEAQAAQVADRYAAWFDMKPAVLRDGWARLEGRRRPAA